MEETLTEERKGMLWVWRELSEKKTIYLFLRNQDWKTVKVETEK